jgi:hypothetical protein
MKKREFWQIEPVQVDRESAFKRQPNLISGCFKRIMKVVLFTCLFIGLGFFYLINWGFDEVVESSARHHSGTAYFYAPWTYEGSIALWIYDGRAPVETVISLGKVHERFFKENRVSLDSAYWSQDESIIIVDVAADRRTRPDGKKPLTGYDFDQHKILTPEEISKTLPLRGGRGREIIGPKDSFSRIARSRRIFENYPMRVFQGN